MDSLLKDKLRNPPKKYRPIPFWSWNEKLDPEETRRQIGLMDEAGIGGYFMHARGGLQTPYMGPDWIENIKTGIQEGKARGMSAWGYDENGWPSGFGDGKVNGRGVGFQQKYLRLEHTCGIVKSDTTILCTESGDGGYDHFYYETNPYYVDTLDPKVTRAFLDAVHEQYRDQLEGLFPQMAGFFTDEPQVSRNGIPWSFILPDAYEKEYGEPLLPLLPSLFKQVGQWQKVRYRFWKLIRDLFTDNFTGQIYAWTQEHGVRFTGHMVLEETPLSQVTSNGAVMPHYEFMDIPGMDWLTRKIDPNTTPLQVASVAHQLGKPQILSETFALCGWDVSFEELKWISEWQMVRGVNLLCPHLEGYSLQGIRKRDYPASLFYQQPWWEEYRLFTDTVSRIGMLLAEGKAHFDVLLLHPQASAWICYDDGQNQGIQELDRSMVALAEALEDHQIPFHYGDERILQRHGKAEGKRLQVGTQQYSVVIVPSGITISKSTYDLLYAYKNQGGILLWCEPIPERIDGEESTLMGRLSRDCPRVAPENIAEKIPAAYKKIRLTTDNETTQGIAATCRSFEKQGCSIYYFVNSKADACQARAVLPGDSAEILDISCGENRPADYSVNGDGTVTVRFCLEQMGSIVLLVHNAEQNFPEEEPQEELERKPINDKFSRKWKIGKRDPNALVLDTCDCYFDGELFSEGIHINCIQEEACRRCAAKEENAVDIRLVFRFQVEEIPKNPVYLAVETPEKDTISVNDVEISTLPVGYYWDTSFQKLDISGHIVRGENKVMLSTRFHQSAAVLEQMEKAQVFESEKNKLTYEDEIEAIYLIGDFGVSTNGRMEGLGRRALMYSGDFSLVECPSELETGSVITQGFPFFSGRMAVSQKVYLAEKELQGRCLRFIRRCWSAVKVRVNGKEAGTVMWKPYEIKLDGFLQAGENLIEIELIGNLRNLLGPHHTKSGESYAVSPRCFFEQSPVWLGGSNEDWTDDVCLVDFGLYV